MSLHAVSSTLGFPWAPAFAISCLNNPFIGSGKEEKKEDTHPVLRSPISSMLNCSNRQEPDTLPEIHEFLFS